MSHPNAKTQPTTPAAKLEYAINLARTGRKLQARDMLRRIVALQPVNQAAWLWLSAVTTDKAEAETALAQARKIIEEIVARALTEPTQDWLEIQGQVGKALRKLFFKALERRPMILPLILNL